MDTNDWTQEMDRLLEIFDRESKKSLRKIDQCFDATGHPFDEAFREHFLEMSTLRLETSFNAILFERRFKNRMHRTPNPSAPVRGNEIASNMTLSTSVAANNFDAPIEIADSDDEDVVEEQQIQNHTEPNPLLEQNDFDGEQRGSDLNHINGVELAELGQNNDSASARNENEFSSAIEMVDDQSQSSTSAINVQNRKQTKSNADKLFKCKNCTYTSRRKSSVNRHQRIHDTNAMKPFKCHHCDYATRYKQVLENHQKIHVQQKLMGIARNPNDGLYKCTQCSQQFAGIGYLSKHLSKAHKNNQRLFNCVHCIRRFTQKSQKGRHETNCQNRRYECHLCKKYVTRSLIHMQSHVRTHSRAKPFQCEVCNKRFRQKNGLKYHLDFVHKLRTSK